MDLLINLIILKAVFVHGVFSCMLTPMKSMKKIGPCENWSLYTMLIDEDWPLRALQNNLWNVWVPYVKTPTLAKT